MAVANDPAFLTRSSPKCLYPFPIAQRFASSEAVFSGRVLEIKRDQEVEEIRFSVFKSWKNLHSAEVLLFNDVDAEAAPTYRVGESYLVFANGSHEKLTTGACSHVEVFRYAGKEIKELRRLTARHRENRK